MSETGSPPDFTTRLSGNEPSICNFTQTTKMSPDNMNTSSLLDTPVTHPVTNDDYRLYLIIGIAAAVGIIASA